MSELGQQRVTIHILLNISRIKDNQIMKFGQLIENIPREISFLKNYAENEEEKLVLDCIFVF